MKQISTNALAFGVGMFQSLTVLAVPPSGATALPGQTGGGGGRVSNTGSTITAEISVGDGISGGVSNVTATGKVQHTAGYTGQLYDTTSLAVSADPAAVVEGQVAQLTAVALMDDGTFTDVAGIDAYWNVLAGAIASIDDYGVATAGDVFINSPATVEGEFDGVFGELELIVINSNSTIPTDPIPDPEFTSQPFDLSQLGLYQGLLKDAGGNIIGSVAGLKLGKAGAFSGKVVFNGKTYKLKGLLDASGAFTGQILRKKLTPLDVSFQIGETASGARTLQGTVEGDGTIGNADIAQAPYHSRNNPAPPELVKSYTFLIPSAETGNSALPGGDGYGSIKVSSSGKIAAVGKTGDGVKFASKGYLTADDQWHLFQLLYRSQGQIAGVLSFRDVPDVSDVDGELAWIKNPSVKQKSYPGGFDVPQWLVGSLFTPPAKRVRALDELADQEYNARLTLAGKTVPDEGISKTISWLNSNSLKYYGPEKLAAKANAKTGLIGGSYYDPFTKTKIKFGGAVLQKQGIASGNYLFANESGYLLIEPGTDFSYPGSESAGLLDLTDTPVDPAEPPTVVNVTFDPLAAGIFNGILNLGGNLTGSFENVKMTSTGGLSGTVWIDGIRYKFKGLLGANGQAQIQILRKNLTPITVDFQLALELDSTGDGFQLLGQVAIDGNVHDFEAQRRPAFDKNNRSPNEGKYTVAMRAPDGTDPAEEPGGDGYGSLAVSYKGTCKGSMILADGTKATMAGHISRNSEWSMHRSLYGAKGYLAGKLTFRDQPGISDIDGNLRWLKDANVKRTKSYVAGFDATRTVIGGIYTPPARGESAFVSLDDSLYNAWFRLAGPDLAPTTAFDITELDRAVTWNTSNRILYYGPDKASIKFSTKTGLASGSYQDKATGVKVKFGGALMQEQSVVTGSYRSGAESGIFTLGPRGESE